MILVGIFFLEFSCFFILETNIKIICWINANVYFLILLSGKNKLKFTPLRWVSAIWRIVEVWLWLTAERSPSHRAVVPNEFAINPQSWEQLVEVWLTLQSVFDTLFWINFLYSTNIKNNESLSVWCSKAGTGRAGSEAKWGIIIKKLYWFYIKFTLLV